MIIGARLKLVRDWTGLSQRALAEAAGLSPAHVRLLEKGLRPDPSASTVIALAGALDVSLDWLLEGEGPAPDPDAVRAAVERARARAALTPVDDGAPPIARAAGER